MLVDRAGSRLRGVTYNFTDLLQLGAQWSIKGVSWKLLIVMRLHQTRWEGVKLWDWL